MLIVGSLPGAESLARGQYYGNPRNQFWQLVGGVIDCDLITLDYPARLACLIEHRIALWDVVATGHRRGSLDAALQIAGRSDLRGLVAQLPELRAIGCNGALAASQAPSVPEHIDLLTLPSSSPANTTALSIKQSQWNALARHLA